MEEIGLINETPFVVEQLFLIDENGREILVLVVKATYLIIGSEQLKIAEKQIPVNMEGEYNGVPGTSSFKFEPEVSPIKVATDVVLIGHAYPDRAGATQVNVSLKIGKLQKVVRVFGDRYWTKSLGFEKITSPKPFDSIPLIYERSFGGWDRSNPDQEKHTYEARNPVGTGYRHKKYGSLQSTMKLPNLEDPKRRIKHSKDRPPPAGFGFIGPEWEPRRKYIGTYDDNWKKKRMPLLPVDFDQRYYNAAHPDLIVDGYLKGNEVVEVINASPRGRVRFNLPEISLPEGKVVMKDNTEHDVLTKLDTVVINTDDNNVVLLWRGYLSVHGKIHDIRSVKVQMENVG